MDQLSGTASGAVLAQLLGEVRCRLWLQSLGRALQIASWLVLGASALAAISSVLFGSQDAAIMWSAAGGLYLAATLIAASRRPAPHTAAAWADRHLGGCSAYTASLEFLTGNAPGCNRTMLAHLDAWTANAVAASRRQLHAISSHWLPARALGAAIIMLALATLTIGLSAEEGRIRMRMQEPSPVGFTTMSATKGAAGDQLARRFARTVQTAGKEEDDSRKGGPDDQGEQDTGLPALQQRDRDAAARRDEKIEERTDPHGMASVDRSPAGEGEQAGQLDAGDEPGGITANDLHLRVARRAMVRDAAGMRSSVDNATGAYQDDSGAGSRSRVAAPPAVRAARLSAGPVAGVTGPAETELVKRYFEQRGRP
jgi:hypothetical protein